VELTQGSVEAAGLRVETAPDFLEPTLGEVALRQPERGGNEGDHGWRDPSLAVLDPAEKRCREPLAGGIGGPRRRGELPVGEAAVAPQTGERLREWVVGPLSRGGRHRGRSTRWTSHRQAGARIIGSRVNPVMLSRGDGADPPLADMAGRPGMWVFRRGREPAPSAAGLIKPADCVGAPRFVESVAGLTPGGGARCGWLVALGGVLAELGGVPDAGAAGLVGVGGNHGPRDSGDRDDRDAGGGETGDPREASQHRGEATEAGAR
jgi:hypothetical protein